MVVIKSKMELAIMRQAGRINAQILAELREAARPGVTTLELNNLANRLLAKHNATPVFKGYHFNNGAPPFPASITVCVNEELVHGIPSHRRLREGDILSVDCGSYYKGYIGDSAFSVGIGKISEEATRLLQITEQSLYVGIEQATVGNRVGDISAAIQDYVERQGYNVVQGYGGHGVGRTMHEEPHVPNYGKPKHGMKLKPGLTLAIEPMVLQGAADVVVMPDQWTVVAKDGKLTAHFEHTVAVTEDGPEILTLL
ncbi:MAG: type I methionyl aminopeptidase [Chloroflexota bacterium]